MGILEQYENGVLTIKISGELDVSMAIELDEVIKNAYNSELYKVCVDCKDLQYISSAGLGVFVSYLDDFLNMNGKFIFYNMNAKVFHVFQILGLHNIMTIVEDQLKVQEIFDES